MSLLVENAMIGRTFAHYQIVRKIGQGGMGEVYLAEDRELGRKVAIKIIRADPTGFTDRRARLLREARAASALNHSNIVTIHEIKQEGETHYIVMEYVDGQTLTHLTTKRSLDVKTFLRLAIPLADALATAHDVGIIHRDVKPDNIIVNNDGHPKILDFGLAKFHEPVSPPVVDSNTAEQFVTELGAVLGTVPFMSPEQAEGRPLDVRTDIFSFGCVLYQMATGRSPFWGETRAELLGALLKDEPPPVKQLRPEVPVELDRIIRKSMQKDPTRRYASARELWRDLQMLKEDLASGQIPSVLGRLRPSPAMAARSLKEMMAWGTVVILLLMIAGLTYSLVHVRAAASPVKARIKLATATPSGVYYAIGSGIAQVIEQRMPDVDVRVLVTQGGFENMKLLDQGETDLALTQADIAFNTVNSERVLGHQSNKIMGMAVLYKEPAQVVVRKGLGIHTLRDLRGRRVVLGLPQSGSRFSSEILLAHFGLRPSDLHAMFVDYPEAADGMINGLVDALIVWRAVPAPVLQELFRTGKVEFLPIDPQMLAGLRLNQPFVVPDTIPAGAYDKQDHSVSTAAVKSVLVASSAVDPKLVKDILAIIFESIPELIAHHPRAGRNLQRLSVPPRGWDAHPTSSRCRRILPISFVDPLMLYH